METCDYRNLMLLHVEEDSVREAPNSSAPPSAIDDWKLQGVLCDRVNRFLDRQDEVTMSLSGSRLAKDRAAQTVAKVMIPEALDYPA